MVIAAQLPGPGTRNEAARGRPQSAVEPPLVRVGFVNNMPDGAFDDTYRQFARLVRARSRQLRIELRRYWIPTVPRGAALREKASRSYKDVQALYSDPPDALIITGTEPCTEDISDEPYWEDLSKLLRWAEANVPSTMLSCLASHAAVRVLDGISRLRLPAKQTGVFVQSVDESHPLGRGLGPMTGFPHSRFNEIPTKELTIYGYRLVVASARTGWTVAVRERDGRLLVLLQGHPEYEHTTLLKEYRRDVRRFANGSGPYPDIPVGYLDLEGTQMLERLRAEIEDGGRVCNPSDFSSFDFPFDAASGHIDASWNRSSLLLFANWIQEVRQRTSVAAIS